jgi:hypothetical protein
MEHLCCTTDHPSSCTNFLFNEEEQHTWWPEGLLDVDAALDISVRGISFGTRNVTHISVSQKIRKDSGSAPGHYPISATELFNLITDNDTATVPGTMPPTAAPTNQTNQPTYLSSVSMNV